MNVHYKCLSVILLHWYHNLFNLYFVVQVCLLVDIYGYFKRQMEKESITHCCGRRCKAWAVPTGEKLVRTICSWNFSLLLSISEHCMFLIFLWVCIKIVIISLHILNICRGQLSKALLEVQSSHSMLLVPRMLTTLQVWVPMVMHPKI